MHGEGKLGHHVFLRHSVHGAGMYYGHTVRSDFCFSLPLFTHCFCICPPGINPVCLFEERLLRKPTLSPYQFLRFNRELLRVYIWTTRTANPFIKYEMRNFCFAEIFDSVSKISQDNFSIVCNKNGRENIAIFLFSCFVSRNSIWSNRRYLFMPICLS